MNKNGNMFCRFRKHTCQKTRQNQRLVKKNEQCGYVHSTKVAPGPPSHPAWLMWQQRFPVCVFLCIYEPILFRISELHPQFRVVEGRRGLNLEQGMAELMRVSCYNAIVTGNSVTYPQIITTICFNSFL